MGITWDRDTIAFLVRTQNRNSNNAAWGGYEQNNSSVMRRQSTDQLTVCDVITASHGRTTEVHSPAYAMWTKCFGNYGRKAFNLVAWSLANIVAHIAYLCRLTKPNKRLLACALKNAPQGPNSSAHALKPDIICITLCGTFETSLARLD